jgi:cyclopropane-fatty-acyl-phospholipid synthase
MSGAHDMLSVQPGEPRVALRHASEDTDAKDAWYTRLLETGLVPDAVVRLAIRRICEARLREEGSGTPADRARRLAQYVEELRRSPIAIATDAANRQHYEVPAGFFERVLGRRLKYSCGYWPEGVETLDEAEEAMLALTVDHARLADGQQVLELGCGWGSLTLHMAERFPSSRITAVSNSHGQRRFIEARARERGLANVRVITADINDFEPRDGGEGAAGWAGAAFDRVVSVEMFEHLRNYEELLARIASWLTPGGLLFVHIFSHRTFAYPYTVRDATDWMAQHFFTGGQMPSDDLMLHFQRDLSLVDRWRLGGTHYEKTSNAWLARMDRHRAAVLPVLAATYGAAEARRWWTRWRVFFMACAELFGYRDGTEWMVSHYLFRRGENQREQLPAS